MSPATAAERLAALAVHGVRLDLAPFRSLLAALGHPERRFPAVLVAGTNGKGSTSALLDSIARAGGLRTGLTTSPHLERIEERIRVAGRAVAAENLATTVERIVATAARDGLPPPTFFEATIAAAFLTFAAAKVELAIIEVGLGGRLDATNLVTPCLSIVTPVHEDHAEILGPTVAAIAREKAGIFRRGVPALLATQTEEADAALASAAARTGAQLHRVADETEIVASEFRGRAGHFLTLRTPVARHQLTLPLAGEHQLANAATAARAAELLAERWPALDAGAVARGIATVRWPGRLESVSLPGAAKALLLDAAHNPDGCAALVRFLDQLEEPFDLLFGALADKEVARMLPPLAARARSVILTRPDSERAMAPERLLGLVALDRSPRVIDDPGAALDAALDGVTGTVVVAGSIFLVGRIRTELRARFGLPAEP